ncbi:hypothetical protein NQ176_g9860 [Zarea fungicola]|uniref:Uncharacterized protein n=1 Tax=Zarea fungicola TaxID=93591 RepID=A0ACC1MLC6_9HYPO|nr:hypothetical protein NQ176_g9860 [Lecanicillium fungicola]
MPLFNIYHPEGTFETTESKAALARDITKVYNLPPFFVTVQFISLATDSVFIGGEIKTDKPFIRITIRHIAVHAKEAAPGFTESITGRIDNALKPHIADKGYDWEYSVTEDPRSFWRINGIAPPPFKSEAELKWRKENKASEWQT